MFHHFGKKNVIDHFNHFEIERIEPRTRASCESVYVRPFNRHDAEAARSLAATQSKVGTPDMPRGARQWRQIEFGFERRKALRIVRPLDQPFQNVAIAVAVVVRRKQRESFLSVRPQVCPEGCVKAASLLR